MVELTLELIALLSRDTLAARDVVEYVGRGAREGGDSNTIELSPVLHGVRSALLLLHPDTGLPYALKLTPDDDSRPTPAALRPVLGEYERALTHPGTPREVVFDAACEGAGWHVVVIAELGPGDVDDAPVASLTFRRDEPGKRPCD